ncbi:MAG: complex I subunit 4 family protein, partial [Methylococcales bacterium]
LMLAAILGLVYARFKDTGTFSFDYGDLLNLQMDPALSFWLMLGFFIAFVTKLPGVPFHTWLPDAHTQAPTAGSVILAGVLLKTGAYGLLRFVVPLFPDAAHSFATVAMALGVVSILYGAHLAFAQTDMKRLIAYTSISHMGFILVGIFAWNELALQGAVMTMLAHGISSAALFIIAGSLQERMHTRDMRRMGGLWAEVPRLSAIALFFSVAALGMPGLGNFIGEFLVLLGAYRADITITAFAALGLIAAPVYTLILIQKAFHTEPREPHRLRDYGRREITLMGLMIVAMVWMGVYPQSMLDLSSPVLENLDQLVRFRN